VIARYAKLIAKWMGIGFIHGVMNTDNVSIAGETIDYGPCAFMDVFHPDSVFSAIDQFGRYAYANQPGIGAWNMAQFATSLIQLMPDRDQAITDFTAAIHRMPVLFEAEWLAVFGAKLGIANPTEDDRGLITDLLDLMAKNGADFTNTFASLSSNKARDQFLNRDAFDAWSERWYLRRSPDAAALMAQTNPKIIPRNHHIEEVIVAGRNGNLAPFLALLTALCHAHRCNCALCPRAKQRRAGYADVLRDLTGRLISKIPMATKMSAKTRLDPTSSPNISQPSPTVRTGERKLKEATPEAG
jgi:uncharacterized protein YdiU (UPF0061 family)